MKQAPCSPLGLPEVLTLTEHIWACENLTGISRASLEQRYPFGQAVPYGLRLMGDTVRAAYLDMSGLGRAGLEPAGHH